ncbi:MAG: phosphatidate cytidylyltransferase, partial [Aquihabitans sp.]
SLRFPLDASADPTRIERPPVQPAPEPVTGPVELPHWTEPPTGEVPAVLIGDDSPLLDGGDDLDAWSSFATSTPRWRDADDDWDNDGFVERLATDSDQVRIGALGNVDDAPSHDEYFGFDDLEERVEERTGDATETPGRSASDNDDWSAVVDETEEPVDAYGQWADEDEPLVVSTGGAYADTFDDVLSEPPPDPVPVGAPGGGDRDMGMATIVGAGLAVLALGLLVVFPTGMVVLVAAALGLAAGEYFGVLRKVGWESATPLGLGACALLPFAIYWRGPFAYGLIGFLVVAAILTWYLVGAGGPDPRVLEGSGSTLLGIIWIGGLGSAATAMLRVHDGRWLLLVGLFATVAYDIGGLFIGRAMGHRPLSAASPNKTVEGLLGGMGCAFLVTVIGVGMLSLGPWTGAGAGIALGLAAALAAPLGDLCQSLLKRDLGVKDMGTLLPGHGGVLDRIDGMLFVLPAMYWIAVSFGHIGL